MWLFDVYCLLFAGGVEYDRNDHIVLDCVCSVKRVKGNESQKSFKIVLHSFQNKQQQQQQKNNQNTIERIIYTNEKQIHFKIRFFSQVWVYENHQFWASAVHMHMQEEKPLEHFH